MLLGGQSYYPYDLFDLQQTSLADKMSNLVWRHGALCLNNL